MSAHGNEAPVRAPLHRDEFVARSRALYEEWRAIFAAVAELGEQNAQIRREREQNSHAGASRSGGDIETRLRDLPAQRRALTTRLEELTAQRVQLQERFEQEIQEREQEIQERGHDLRGRGQELQNRGQELQRRGQELRHRDLRPRSHPDAPEATSLPAYTPSDQIIQQLRQEIVRLKESNHDQKQTIVEWKEHVDRLSWSILTLSAVLLLGFIIGFRFQIMWLLYAAGNMFRVAHRLFNVSAVGFVRERIGAGHTVTKTVTVYAWQTVTATLTAAVTATTTITTAAG